MIASTTSLLTALAMLVHSVGGCCWHHPHSETSAAGGHAIHAADSEHVGHLGSHSHKVRCALTAESSSESDDHDRHGACNEGKCQYLKGSASDIDLLCSVWAAVLPAGVESCEALTSDGPHSQVVDVRPLSAPSVRAMTQAWLL